MVNHLGGTMHTNIGAQSGGNVGTECLDWVGTHSSDHYFTITQSSTPGTLGSVTLDLTKNGHRYQIIMSVPRDFLLDGNQYRG